MPLLPIVLGIVAVLAVGAFFAFKLKPETKRKIPPLREGAVAERPAPAAPATTVATTPAKPETPKPKSPLKEEPKPMAAAPVMPAPAAPAKRIVVAQAPAAPKTEAPAVTPRADGLKPPASLPPELATLDTQFQKLQAERVTTPFEADVSKLNTGYLGAVDREMAKEKAAGHLDGILALEAEKKLIADKQPVPDADDDKTPASLKALRVTYRAAHAKLASQCASNLNALTEPLDKRLTQMEADFVKGDRLADAKTVRGYREALAETQSSLGLQPVVASQHPSGLKPKTTLVNPAATLALKDGITNTLGMKFIPVKGTNVLFCIHEARYKDYAAYAAENPGVDGSWKDQTYDGFALTERAEEHPVTRLCWEDAKAFCAWLSKKEGRTYRLPTDREWSYAVGIGREEKWTKDTTPESLSGKVKGEFPWGRQESPPAGSGNYSDQSRKGKAPQDTADYLDGYDDGFPTTAPVMSFKPNKLGLYDMGGNVSELCEDWHNPSQQGRVVRGVSWRTPPNLGNLPSSQRFRSQPGNRYNYDFGFRCVLVVSGG